MSLELFLISYFVIATLVAIWGIGVIHAYEIKHFYIINTPPAYLFALGAYLLILPFVFTILTVYGTKEGWLWPKKGVTYDKNFRKGKEK